MVRITNGLNTIEVSRGAYNTIFSKQGFSIVDEPEKPVDVNPDGSDGMFDEDAFVEEIMEKPISQWTGSEVKKFASIKGVDISGTKNVNEAKERIKSFLSM